MQRIFFTLLMIASLFAEALAQPVAINDDGTAADPSAALDVKSTSQGLLLPRLTSTQRVLLPTPADGLLIYDSTSDRIYNYVSGTGWRSFITGSYWQNFTNTVYNSADNIGIGISTPQERLHIAGGNFKVASGDLSLTRQAGLSQRITFDYTGASPNGFTQGVDYYMGSVLRRAYVNFTASTTAGNDALKFFPTASGPHNFTMTSGGEFRWNGTIDPTIQLQDASVNKGFLQLAGQDLRMGTNSGNPGGKIIIRTDGADRVFITSTGRVGIGELVPSQALHVAGTVYASGNIDVNTTVTTDNLEFSGKLSKPSVSSAALTPLCYGSVYANGTVRSVTPNATITKTSTGFYVIDCAGIDENCVILVTPADERHVGNGFHSVANKATVSIFYDSSTAPPPARDSDFCFIIYKK